MDRLDEVADFPTTRKRLLGIKRRAEATATPTALLRALATHGQTENISPLE